MQHQTYETQDQYSISARYYETELCGRIAIMNEGQFVERGTADELKRIVTQRLADRGDAREPSNPVTMEDVFIQLTGKQWLSAEEDTVQA